MKKTMHQSNRTRNRKNLGKRLAAYAVGVAGATALVPHADAAVTPVTFGFGAAWDSTDNPVNNRTTFTVGPGFGTISFYTSSYFASFGGGGYHGTRNPTAPPNDPTPNAFVYGDGVNDTGNPGSKVKFLPNGTVIGTGLNGTPSTATASMAVLHWRDNNGNPAFEMAGDVLGFNFGFKTETGHFGWANADWKEGVLEDSSPSIYGTLIINQAFVESIAGEPITIGAAEVVPEPSTIALLSVGAAGLLGLRQLRRRSKQAASSAS